MPGRSSLGVTRAAGYGMNMKPPGGRAELDVDGHAVVVLDGECSLCQRSAQFIVRRDPRGYFRFAAQQSRVGQALLAQAGMTTSLESVVLVEGSVAYAGSDAVLRIAAQLHGAWRLARFLLIVPRPVREFAYRIVARHRYRFGRRDACAMPPPDQRVRYLDL